MNWQKVIDSLTEHATETEREVQKAIKERRPQSTIDSMSAVCAVLASLRNAFREGMKSDKGG